MAETIGFAILSALAEAGVTAAAGASAAAATAVGSAAILGASLGGQLLISALTAPKQRDQAQQATLNEAMGARIRIYGRAMVGGKRAFWDARNNNLYQIIMIATDRIDGIEQYWIGDRHISTSEGEAGGATIDYPYFQRIQFEAKLGDKNQAASGIIRLAYPEMWTAAHQLNGIAYVACLFLGVKKEEVSIIYPQGYATVLRFVVRGARVWDTSNSAQDPDNDATWAFSESPALCILDYLRHRDGMRFARSRMDVPSFEAFRAECAEAVARKDGTLEPRYRIGGTYSLLEAPKNVLARMCDTCDAQLVRRPSGLIGIRGGKYVAPLVNISTKNIVTASVTDGVDKLDAYNRMSVSYTDPDNFYGPTELLSRKDEASQARVGQLDTGLDLVMVPSWTQAARLAKIRFDNDNPDWKGTLGTDFSVLDALDQETAQVTFDPVPEIGPLIDAPCRLSSFSIRGELSGCDVGFASVRPSTYQWDPATEEPPRPTAPTAIQSIDVIAKPIVSIRAERRAIGNGTVGVWAVVTWLASSRADVIPEAQVKLTGSPDTEYRQIGIRADSLSAEAGPLTDTQSFTFRVRFRIGGKFSDWSDTATLAVTADATAPAVPTYTSATINGNVVTHSFKQSSSGNARGIQVFQAVGYGKTLADVVALPPVLAEGPNQSDTTTTPVDVGVYTYGIKSLNGSDVASAAAGPKVIVAASQPGNVTQFPNDLSNAVWIKTGIGQPVAQGTGPDGAQATFLPETATGTATTHTVAYKATGLTSGSKLRAIWGLKAAGRSAGRIDLINSGGTGSGDYIRATFDLTAGTISIGNPSGTTFSGATATIQKVSPDFYLLILTANTSASAGTTGAMAVESRLNLSTGGTTISYAGDTTKGLLAWACSLAPVT
ncbi:phage tail protein [Methylobacterium sp. W2]|uniref:phage tail protein n=1 Tax=Methylobacterium sp. W2 TaxID=2598107 RepID=UPI001D0CC659|nr:phage tail protein [Methylobacterium sp. W2]